MRLQELLNEYKATPTSLTRMARNIRAIAGFEMEMAASETDGDPEPDMSEDESAYSIDDIMNFFNDWEHNSRNTINYVRQEMQEDFESWVEDEADSAWRQEDQADLVRQYILNNDYSFMDMKELWLDKFFDDNPGATEPSDEVISNGAEKLLDEMVEEAIDLEDSYYEKAKEEWLDDWRETEATEEAWLSSIGIDSMSEVPDHYSDLTWPHYTSSGMVDRDTVAYQISSLLERPARASSLMKNQHPANTYLIFDDVSIKTDEGEDDHGVEIVSPPLPPYAMMADYRRIVQWAASNDYTTNETTGLHMNVSLKDYDMGDLDYVKLVLLLGEEYVSELYDRFDTYYAASAVKKLEIRRDHNPDKVDTLLRDMRSGLQQAAIEMFHNGWTDKNTSVHPHDGRVEFRFPGGNYLDMDVDVIENTLMRCIVALDAAVNPQKFRREYLKKLYKLLRPYAKSADEIDLYVRYSAGELPRAALKSFIKQRRHEKGKQNIRVPDEDMVGNLVRKNNPDQGELPFGGELGRIFGDEPDDEAVRRALGAADDKSWRDTLRARLNRGGPA